MKKVAIFNYNSKFAQDITRTIRAYNLSRPLRPFDVNMFNFEDIRTESEAGTVDLIIHSGGDGRPVKEDTTGVPRLYICFSHEWKAVLGGGVMIELSETIKDVREIEVIKDDPILGPKGKMSIMKYHELAITAPPADAEVIAVSRSKDKNGREVEIIEALRYKDGSLSLQGHPEEGTAAHVFHNFLDMIGEKPSCGTPLQPA
jgi:GMP synthase-like glutamine amidotransferase